MNKNKFRFLFKYIIVPIILVTIIIAGIMLSLSILKDESIQNYSEISKLHSEIIEDNINQNISNIESIIDNINSIIKLEDTSLVQKNKLDKLLKNYPQIRSFNVLKNNKIMISSNMANIGLDINTDEFYPKPFFNKNILRISQSWIGRDFNKAKKSSKTKKSEAKALSFIPILKKSKIDNKFFEIIVNLNSDYFINRYLNNLASKSAEVSILRLDGETLLSTNQNQKNKLQIKQDKLFLKSLEASSSSGIEEYMGNENILTYKLSKNYPIVISLRLDLEHSLSRWKEKRYQFFIITTILVLITVMLALFLFWLYSKEKEKEIMLHKLQVQNHTKFKVLFENTNLLTIFIQEDGSIDEANSRCLNLIGKEFYEIKKLKFWELECWKEDNKESIKNLIQNYKQNSQVEKEVILINKNNKEKIINLIFTSIELDNKIELVILGLDITIKKEKENLLKQSFTVFNNMHDGIMITDKEKNMIRVNPAFEVITGYKESEVIGKNPRILQSSFHNKEFYKKMWNNLNEHGFWEGEIINKNKNSEILTEWLTINTVYDDQNKIVNYIGVFSDISSLKEQEKSIKENEEILFQQSKMAAMGEMIENIAHQWRQPLSVISTIATGLKFQKEYGIANEENEIKDLSAINESAQYLSNTIEDFKGFLKNDKEASTFNSISIVNKSLKLIGSKLKNREIHIIKNIEDIDIFTLENELIQTLINILNNAKDALEDKKPNKKMIFINLSKKDEDIIIEIKDNAGGIPAKIINRIFEPYYTTKHQSQGTGIGLYMSEEIIKNHIKGSISVKNEEYIYQNESFIGASFKIIIPICIKV